MRNVQTSISALEHDCKADGASTTLGGLSAKKQGEQEVFRAF